MTLLLSTPTVAVGKQQVYHWPNGVFRLLITDRWPNYNNQWNSSIVSQDSQLCETEDPSESADAEKNPTLCKYAVSQNQSV